MMPGMMVRPATSTRSASAGTSTASAGPTPAIRPSRTSRTPFSTGAAPVPSISARPRSASRMPGARGPRSRRGEACPVQRPRVRRQAGRDALGFGSARFEMIGGTGAEDGGERGTRARGRGRHSVLHRLWHWRLGAAHRVLLRLRHPGDRLPEGTRAPEPRHPGGRCRRRLPPQPGQHGAPGADGRGLQRAGPCPLRRLRRGRHDRPGGLLLHPAPPGRPAPRGHRLAHGATGAPRPAARGARGGAARRPRC
jgi:hypothetical protein